MSETNSDERRKHPDLFTKDEAVAYLHLEGESETTIDTLRKEHGLIGFRVGMGFYYHRAHLDSLVLRLAGIDQKAAKMKMAQ